MDLAEYSKCDGVALADLVRRGDVTPKELAHLLVEAVEKVNPTINAVLEVYLDRVEVSDDKSISDGPFLGVPFLMKDIGAGEKGRHQESGSKLMQGHVADNDSFLTTFFKKAGLTLLGRTTTPEFALGISTESELVGVTHNPWNPNITSGGSSGGAAASVAAGIVPIAHGSDNGGSIRIPASACGLVGLKPSRGRVTLGPDIGELWPGMLQEFVLSRTVRDTAVMLDAVSKPVLGDPFIIKQPDNLYVHELNAPTGKMRIAWTTDPWQPDGTVDSEVVNCVEQVVSQCEEAGHEMDQVSPTFDYEEYLHAVCVAWAFGVHMGMDMFASIMGRKVSEETVEPVMLSFYEYSRRLTAVDMFMAEFALNQFRRNFGEFFQQYDLLLTPTLNKLPEPHGKYSKMRKDLGYEEYMRLCEETKVHTTAANVTGQPAITLPLGQSRSGLPIGIQFMARFGEEDTLIRLSSSLEKEMPWHHRIPPIHASR